jgi:hypothetical protein
MIDAAADRSGQTMVLHCRRQTLRTGPGLSGFRLKAGRGEVIALSETYESWASALNGRSVVRGRKEGRLAPSEAL